MRQLVICPFLLVLLFSSAGCHTHNFLRRNVTKQTATLTDILYTQVLDNLAMSVSNPASLPHFAIIGEGTTQDVDAGQGTAGLTWSPFTLATEALTMNGSRSLQENWKLQPVMSAGRLRRLRCAYQLVLSGAHYHLEAAPKQQSKIVLEGDTCIDCVGEMIKMKLLPNPEKFEGWKESLQFETELKAQAYAEELVRVLNCNFPQGWYGVGECHGSAQDVCYRGRHCGTQVWVNSAGIDALSRFTMTVLQLAANDPDPPKTPVGIADVTAPKRLPALEYSPFDRSGNSPFSRGGSGIEYNGSGGGVGPMP